ncbi:MAG: GNAT family N-acetyltransferase [Clostridiales bacterium]|nr:GNAT family N-acetyltransferase [Clostridiales bacterium]
MIRFASSGEKNGVLKVHNVCFPSEAKALLRLFNICFPGEEDFAEYFFKYWYSFENTLVDEENGVIRGLAMMYPYYIEGVGEVTYLYSVGTSPEFRGRGVCKGILEYSHKIDLEKGRKASILIPGGKDLFDFYKKLGYEVSSCIDEREFTVLSENTSFKLKECTPKELEAFYKSHFKGRKAVRRNEKYFYDQIKLFNSFGGECLGLYDSDKLLSYGFYSCENGVLKFDEILGENCDVLASEVLKKNGLSRCKGRTDGSSVPIGMAYYYGKKFDFYMNLMFN